ncbi:MAG: hypothetical protein IT210_15860 [Armatimonadetes bacterium]|nr:hypothetical protein [Armatimonadota bacterium]
MRIYLYLIITFILIGGKALAKPVADRIGVTHVAGKYALTEKDYLNEGADALLKLGTRVIKLWCVNPSSDYPFHSQWPPVKTMADILKAPYFKKVFKKPFSTYVLEAFPVHTPVPGEGRYSEAEVRDAGEQMYEAARYLLTAYRRTNKTFIFQNWKGDWAAREKTDLAVDPTPEALAGMERWLNARQDGLDRAKREVGEKGVRVYHAAEVNLVKIGMEGRPSVTTDVLPKTRCDLYSYSAYDTLTDRELFKKAVAFIRSKAPDSRAFGENNVYIGEFGWPEMDFNPQEALQHVRNVVEASLEMDIPYMLYWELYCNEPRNGGAPKGSRPANDQCRGFWLIRPDGSFSPVYDYFKSLIK